jgi:hypothetical protein
MKPIHKLRDRRRTVIICRRVTEGRALLRSLGWPLVTPRPAPAVPHFTWSGWWALGHPPPFLIVDDKLRAEDVRGADLVIEVLGAERVAGRIVHVIARHVGVDRGAGLVQRLREAGARDTWQPREWCSA